MTSTDRWNVERTKLREKKWIKYEKYTKNIKIREEKEEGAENEREQEEEGEELRGSIGEERGVRWLRGWETSN